MNAHFPRDWFGQQHFAMLSPPSGSTPNAQALAVASGD